MTGGEVTALDFGPRLIELLLYFIGDFKLVLKEFVNPSAQGFDFRAGETRDSGFNFFDGFHRSKITGKEQSGKLEGGAACPPALLLCPVFNKAMNLAKPDSRAIRSLKELPEDWRRVAGEGIPEKWENGAGCVDLEGKAPRMAEQTYLAPVFYGAHMRFTRWGGTAEFGAALFYRGHLGSPEDGNGR